MKQQHLKQFFFILFLLSFGTFGFLYAQRLSPIDLNSTATGTENSSSSLSTSTTATTTFDFPEPENNYDNLPLEKNSAGVAITSSRQVGSEDDLIIMSENLKIINPNLKKLTIDTTTDGATVIVVDYKHPGRFLGLLPVNYRSITTVTSSTNSIPSVDTKLSFWSGFVSDKKIDTDAIESRILANPIVKTDLQTNSSPAAKARVAEAVVKELDANEMETFVPEMNQQNSNTNTQPAQGY